MDGFIYLVLCTCYLIFTKESVPAAIITNNKGSPEARVSEESFISYSAGNSESFYYDAFPPDFRWGVSSSSYQTEGAWNLDGKGESIWDHFTHLQPSKISDNSTADIACDSYHHYKDDIQLLQNVQAKIYRFSIAWSRILPKGTTEVINQAGIDYYNNLINELVSKGIQPMATLQHHNLPQNLQESGGWANEQIIGPFAEYARICFDKFGDRVKLWVTINAPTSFCLWGYTDGTFAPGVVDPANGPYQCLHSLIKAHTLVYLVYKEQFKPTQKGKVGIAVDFGWQEPENPKSEDDKRASDQAIEFRLGWIINPILKGDYPESMKKIIGENSKKEHLKVSRLPLFDSDWKQKINGSTDFVGINHYTTELVRFVNTSVESPSWKSDCGVQRFFDPTWPPTGSTWMKVVPWGLRKALNYIKDHYSNPEVIITENGVSDMNCAGELEDTLRQRYFRLYINEALKAIKLDGCNLTTYIASSLLDSFEWNRGYTEKFGLYSVNFNSPNRTRTAKKSATSLAKIFQDNGFLSHLSHTSSISANTTKQFSAFKLAIVVSVTPFVILYVIYM